MAAESGAILSQAPEEAIQALRSYGYNLGLAFQLVDDILDFTGGEAKMGKPVGNDLLQGTVTLPAILLIEQSPGNNPIEEILAKQNPDKRFRLTAEITIIIAERPGTDAKTDT